MTVKEKQDRFALVSVTWNKHKWERVDRESISKHRYPGLKHEHFNFKFNKDHDTYKHIHGYAPAFSKNIRLCYDESAVIFFIATNHMNNERKIVGVYGNVTKVRKRANIPEYEEENGLELNIRAERKYSMRFSNYLDARAYKFVESMKQTTIRYIDEAAARDIVLDAIEKCGEQDRTQLHSILELVTGRSFEIKVDESIAEKLVEEIPDSDLKVMVENIPAKSGKITERTTLIRERDCRVIEAIKKLRGRQCQICGVAITTKHGIPYVEAAHINPKHAGGSECPENIIILCPNHHKEFDLGNKKILSTKNNNIMFIMNGKNYRVDLSLEPSDQN